LDEIEARDTEGSRTHFERLIALERFERRRTKRTGPVFLHSKVHPGDRKSKNEGEGKRTERTRRTSRKILSEFARELARHTEKKDILVLKIYLVVTWKS